MVPIIDHCSSWVEKSEHAARSTPSVESTPYSNNISWYDYHRSLISSYIEENPIYSLTNQNTAAPIYYPSTYVIPLIFVSLAILETCRYTILIYQTASLARQTKSISNCLHQGRIMFHVTIIMHHLQRKRHRWSILYVESTAVMFVKVSRPPSPFPLIEHSTPLPVLYHHTSREWLGFLP